MDDIDILFTDEASENAEWGHGNFPLEEYAQALERSKEELYYNHSLGMRYSKVWSWPIHISYMDWLCVVSYYGNVEALLVSDVHQRGHNISASSFVYMDFYCKSVVYLHSYVLSL